MVNIEKIVKFKTKKRCFKLLSEIENYLIFEDFENYYVFNKERNYSKSLLEEFFKDPIAFFEVLDKKYFKDILKLQNIGSWLVYIDIKRKVIKRIEKRLILGNYSNFIYYKKNEDESEYYLFFKSSKELKEIKIKSLVRNIHINKFNFINNFDEFISYDDTPSNGPNSFFEKNEIKLKIINNIIFINGKSIEIKKMPFSLSSVYSIKDVSKIGNDKYIIHSFDNKKDENEIYILSLISKQIKRIIKCKTELKIETSLILDYNHRETIVFFIKRGNMFFKGEKFSHYKEFLFSPEDSIDIKKVSLPSVSTLWNFKKELFGNGRMFLHFENKLYFNQYDYIKINDKRINKIYFNVNTKEVICIYYESKVFVIFDYNGNILEAGLYDKENEKRFEKYYYHGNEIHINSNFYIKDDFNLKRAIVDFHLSNIDFDLGGI